MAADVGIASWVTDHDDVLKAIGTFAFWILLAFVVDRWFAARGRKLAGRVLKSGISQQADTRLRFVRRLVWLALIVIGILLALTQFTGIQRVAASLLASGALAAAIIGFAARQTLANLVAGIMLAITQPLRVGDWVFFESEYGVVDDIRLTYTFLTTLEGQRVIIPNERLAAGILRNDTLGEGAVGPDVHIWLPRSADVGRAVATLHEATGLKVTVAETTVDGIRLSVAGERCAPPERAAREAELRLRCLELLRADGLLAVPE